MSENVQEQRENNVGGITGKGFVPGQSGNPGGRPKGSGLITGKLRALLEDGDGKAADELAKALLRLAKKGNAAAIKQVVDRIDGPITEETEHSGGLTINVRFGDDHAPEFTPRPSED